MPFTAFDRIDRAIIVELQRDSRIANKELAARVGVAPSTCLERVRRLVSRKVLRGFHAEVDLAAIGRSIQAIIAVRLTVHSRNVIDQFYAHVLDELPATVSVFHVGGADDYLIHVAVPDMTQLRNLVLDLTARREVEHVETRIIFEHRRRAAIEPLAP